MKRTFVRYLVRMTETKPTLRGEALKTKVLETALEMFSARGYFNTSIHDIRREAGVSTGAIYHHFQNKEYLAKSLYESLLLQMDDAIAQACVKAEGSLEKSRAIITKLFDLTMQQPKTMQFVLLAQHREYLPDEAPICSSKPFQAMKQVIVDGINAGEVRDIEPWVAATAMFGGALRMMSLELDHALDQPLEAYLDEVVHCGWLAIKID